MEFVQGVSLYDLVAERGPLAVSEVVRIGMQLCSALDAVHTANVVHQDVKPQNVLCETSTNRIVLMDFGAGRWRHSGEGSQPVTGTPRFTAPEVLDGAAPSPQSDLRLGRVALLPATARPRFRPRAGSRGNRRRRARPSLRFGRSAAGDGRGCEGRGKTAPAFQNAAALGARRSSAAATAALRERARSAPDGVPHASTSSESPLPQISNRPPRSPLATYRARCAPLSFWSRRSRRGVLRHARWDSSMFASSKRQRSDSLARRPDHLQVPSRS